MFHAEDIYPETQQERYLEKRLHDSRPTVEFDSKLNLALIAGPGGFTQVPMTDQAAYAVATALGVSLRVV